MAREYEEFQVEDDSYTDVFVLFVLEDVPTSTINEVRQKAFEESGANDLWLADTYDTLVNIEDAHEFNLRFSYVSEDWKSPFIGKSLEDAAEFVKNARKPPKGINKVHFVVLDREQYEKNDFIIACKIVDGEVQTLGCGASMISSFLTGHNRDTWEGRWERWQRGWLCDLPVGKYVKV